MRTSRLIRPMVLIGAIAMLAACDGAPPDNAVFFPDVAACQARYDRGKCEEASAKAAAVHLDHAPISLLKAECEADFGTGHCETRYMPSKRTYYAPAMQGFLTDGSFSVPVYSEVDGSAVAPVGDYVYFVGRFSPRAASGGDRPAAKHPAHGAVAPPFNRSTAIEVSRQGFGARISRGGFGGSAVPRESPGG